MISHENFRVGDEVKVQFKIWEGGKERPSQFIGTVIAISGRGQEKMMTVRRKSTQDVAVERIFPLFSPNLMSVTVKRKGKIRRAKLYYLRKSKKKIKTAS